MITRVYNIDRGANGTNASMQTVTKTPAEEVTKWPGCTVLDLYRYISSPEDELQHSGDTTIPYLLHPAKPTAEWGCIFFT